MRPRDLNRLLSNFQSSLQEITVIATEPTSLPSEAAIEIEGKAVELRSYIDPTKGDNDKPRLINIFHLKIFPPINSLEMLTLENSLHSMDLPKYR